jgi:Ser/Thr protein kinase RdoA (MazF antagonist)
MAVVGDVTGLQRIGVGRNADVFAVDERRVLRRYRDDGEVTAEADVMTYLADQGFPVPVVYAAEGSDLMMERLDGPTMLGALIRGEIGLEAAARVLADLHRRLHQVPPRHGGESILHLDLHPDNVMLTSRGPVVIDWRNQAEGPADLDVALTAVILAQVAVDEPHDLAASARVLLAQFLACAGGHPARMVDRAVAMRRADGALTAREVALLGRAAALIHASLC